MLGRISSTMRFITITEHSQTPAPSAGDAQTAPLEQTQAKTKTGWLAPALVLLAVALFGLLTLVRFPYVFVDEGSNASRAWALLHTGRAFASVDNGIYQHYDGYWTYFPYVGALLQAIFVWLFGLSLGSLRIASLFFGLLLLLAVYFISRKLHGHRAALFAMALLAISAPFVLSSHLGRHDIIVAAIGYGAIALYLTDQKSSLSVKSVLAGLAIGLALDIHPNALIFGPMMLTLFLLDYGKEIWRTGRFWGFVLGGLLGVLFYVSIHILPYPQTYFAIAELGNGSSRTPPILTVDISVWERSLVSTLDLLDLLLLPVLVPAIIMLVRRQSRSDVKVLALFGTSILAMAAVILNKAPYYAILIAPTVPLILAPYVDYVTQKPGKITEWTFWRNVVVLSIVVVLGFTNLAPAIRGSDAEFRQAEAFLQEKIPTGSLVYGSATYWFALHDTRYVNWEQLVLQQRTMPDATFTDAVQALEPDYITVDDFMQGFITDDDLCRISYHDIPCIPKAEFNTLVTQDGTLVGELKTGQYGDIRVYKMKWASPPSGAGR
jgi:4-amino-4-deoxy-L-arabinose transferase-like glycosyltransferase